MNKKRLIHYLSFGSASVLTVFLSIFFFSKLNNTIEKYYSVQTESETISRECVGLRKSISDLTSTLNKINDNTYKWHCTNPSIYCNVYLQDTDIDQTAHTCLECGCQVVEINDTHISQIQTEINTKQAVLSEKQVKESEYTVELTSLHDESQKYQGFAIVFAPVSIVLVLLTLFASKE